MNKPSVVIVGHVCIDRNKSEHATYTGWGSGALYMAQVFGDQYQYATKVVTNYGPDIVPHLPVVTLVPSKPTQARTLIYENDSSQLSRKRIQRCYNTDAAAAPALTPQIQRQIAKADIVVVATLLPNYTADYIRELLSHARPSALKVLCPQGFFRHIDQDGLVSTGEFKDAVAIAGQFDVVVYSEEDCADAFTEALQLKLNISDTQVVITQGSQGASIVHADSVQRIPTTPLAPEEVVDSVGCGDVFAAAMAHAYYGAGAQPGELPAAIASAHQVAARKLLSVIAD